MTPKTSIPRSAVANVVRTSGARIAFTSADPFRRNASGLGRFVARELADGTLVDATSGDPVAPAIAAAIRAAL